VTASDSPVKDEANVNKEETHLLEEVARVLADFDKKNQDNGQTNDDDDDGAGPADTAFSGEENGMSDGDKRVLEERELVDEELENLVGRHSPIFKFKVSASVDKIISLLLELIAEVCFQGQVNFSLRKILVTK